MWRKFSHFGHHFTKVAVVGCFHTVAMWASQNRSQLSAVRDFDFDLGFVSSLHPTKRQTFRCDASAVMLSGLSVQQRASRVHTCARRKYIKVRVGIGLVKS